MGESGRGVREVFHSLVNDETGHLRVLQAEYAAVQGDGRWLPAASTLPTLARELTLFPKGPSAAAKAAASAGDLEALKLAMDIEQKGYDLYVQAAQETADSDGQALYRRLAKAESLHYRALQDAYGFLTHPEHWFDDEEKPMFEG